MQEIIIHNQAELDALPAKFDEYTRIIIKDTTERVYVRVARENSSVVAWENSSVVARENSSVEAWENSSVVAWENSSVVARENSSVVARENSSVVAWGNSSVVAWGNSSVVAWENSSVEAWENSSVVAWENSSVEAWGNVGVHLTSDYATVTLFMFSVCWKLAKGEIEKKSKTATIIEPEPIKDLASWLDQNAVEDGKKITLYKRVSKNWLTQEGTKNETNWKPGTKLDHPDWNPDNGECGPGKFHACSRTFFCDEFRDKRDDRYIALKVKKEDLFVWPNPEYPHKIAFKACEVLYEVDKKGNKIV